MKWEEFSRIAPHDSTFRTRRTKTEVECPKCGKQLWKRTDIILTSNPPQYRYECDCGWVGCAFR